MAEMKTMAIKCANCGAGDLTSLGSDRYWCQYCKNFTHLVGVNREPEILNESDIGKEERQKLKKVIQEAQKPPAPREMTLSDKIVEIVLQIILYAFIVFLLRSCWKANYYDIDLDTLGRYEIPPITCPNDEAVIVTFGYFGEEPLLYSHVGGQWQISEEIKHRIATKRIYSAYIWVYCDNVEKDPGYTVKGSGSFFTLPRPEDGLKIVIRGAEPKP